jgi:WXG100 family type VII secretion target
MAGYTVDVDALRELQNRMQQYLTQCREGLDRVESLIGTVSASWDGTAAAAYEQRHREWIAALGEMSESLNEFSEWSSAAEDAYRAAMAANLRMAGGG